MNEKRAKALWVSLKAAQTGAEVFEVLMGNFESQDQVAKYLGVSKSRISEMKGDDSRLTDRRRTAVFGALMRLQLDCV